jgi:hypothetical protein
LKLFDVLGFKVYLSLQKVIIELHFVELIEYIQLFEEIYFHGLYFSEILMKDFFVKRLLKLLNFFVVLNS